MRINFRSHHRPDLPKRARYLAIGAIILVGIGLSNCALGWQQLGLQPVVLPSSPTPFPIPPTRTDPLPATGSPTPDAPATPTPWPIIQSLSGANGHPTLADLWLGHAEFLLQVEDTGLPMGESDTLVMGNGELWSYLHASARSAGTIDRCGDPVEFPGCTVIVRSYDGGYSFLQDAPPTCQFDCAACPCEAERDHVVQQQYPRVAFDGRTMVLVYEYLGRVMLRRSTDGLVWSTPERVAESGIWKHLFRYCPPSDRIGVHPFVPYEYECLAGGPPGVYLDGETIYVFMALGQNPGGMGCFHGNLNTPAEKFERCQHNPLFVGAGAYGPLAEKGPTTNPYFDFRMLSSAEVIRVNDRYYMLFEGIRGPGPNDPGDSQFGLGLARSMTDQIDGPWEKYAANPLLVDLPGNIGLGHADLVIIDGQTILYTSLDGQVRSRLALVWKTF